MGQLVHPEKLTQVHPKLISTLKRAAAKLPFDVVICQGARTNEQCYENFGKGRTPAECIKGNCPAKYSNPHLAKVTFLGHALSSNHRIQADGFGHAVDAAPAPYNPKESYERQKQLADAVLQAAKELGFAITWGGNWIKTKDFPHFELAK